MKKKTPMMKLVEDGAYYIAIHEMPWKPGRCLPYGLSQKTNLTLEALT